MPRPLRTLTLAGLALATGLLLAPAATAAPVFDDPSTVLDPGGSTNNSGGTCTSVGSGGTEPSTPVVENGPLASAGTSYSATFGNTVTPADTGSASATMAANASITSSGGSLNTMDFFSSGTGQLTDALGGTSTCTRGLTSYIELEFKFTVTQPGFVTFTTKNAGSNNAHDIYGEVYLYQSDSADYYQPYVDAYGFSTAFNDTLRVYLPAGTYTGYFEGDAYIYATHSEAPFTGTTTVHGVFHATGSQTQPAAGKATKYVTLAGARSCASHSVAASVTGKRKLAKQIKQVSYFVDDHKVKTVKKPGKGDSVALAVADGSPADVRPDVTLFPSRPGRKAKTFEATSSYEACTP